MRDAIVGGVFGLLAAGLGALLAYYLSERKARAEREDAAKIRHDEQVKQMRSRGATLLSEIATFLHDCTAPNRWNWSDNEAGSDERRRELRGRSRDLRAQLYQLVSSETDAGEVEDADRLASLMSDVTIHVTSFRADGTRFDGGEELFNEAVDAWAALRTRLSLEDVVLIDPRWTRGPYTAYGQRVLDKFVADKMEGVHAALRKPPQQPPGGHNPQ